MGIQSTKETVIKVVVLMVSAYVVTSCTTTSDIQDVEPVKKQRYVDTICGKVTSYELDSGIVLIQTFGRIKTDTPDVFLVRGAGGTLGTLKLTGQSNKFFIAAEKLSGVVAEGDTVYRRRLNTELEAEDAPVVPSGGATEVGPQDNVGAMEPVRPEKQDPLALP